MVEDIVLNSFSKESGIYLFKANDEVIYVGSSKNLYMRMVKHRSCIRKCSEHGYKQDLYQFLQSNPFTVEFQIIDNYRQLEQQLVEKYNPKYNAIRAYTGLGAKKGRETEYIKEYDKKYKEQVSEQKKKYRESHKEQKKQYNNQLCFFNGETLTLAALSKRFERRGIDHPTAEAKKYIINTKF